MGKAASLTAPPASAQPSSRPCQAQRVHATKEVGTNGNIQLGTSHGFGEGTLPAHVQAPCGLAQLSLPHRREL